MVSAMLATQLTPLSPFFSHRFFLLANDQLPCSFSASQDTDVALYHLSVCESLGDKTYVCLSICTKAIYTIPIYPIRYNTTGTVLQRPELFLLTKVCQTHLIDGENDPYSATRSEGQILADPRTSVDQGIASCPTRKKM